MASQIFVNLTVQDLQRSVNFFIRLGWDNGPRYTDDA